MPWITSAPAVAALFEAEPSIWMPGVNPRMTELNTLVRALRRRCAPRPKFALMLPVGRCVRGPRIVTFENVGEVNGVAEDPLALLSCSNPFD